MVQKFKLFAFWGSYHFFLPKSPGPGEGGRWILSFFPSARRSYRFVFLLPINLPKDNRIPTSSSRRVEEGKKAHCGFPDGGP